MSFATDAERKNVCAYGVFTGTHTGPGGPCPSTGKTLHNSDYVYVMDFEGDKIRRMTKIWPDTWALKQLGWARCDEMAGEERVTLVGARGHSDLRALPTARARSLLLSGFCSISRPASRRPGARWRFLNSPSYK
jgi:hypothetical protein